MAHNPEQGGGPPAETKHQSAGNGKSGVEGMFQGGVEAAAKIVVDALSKLGTGGGGGGAVHKKTGSKAH